MTWVTDQVTAHDLAGKHTLELGSRNINGSVRPLFTGHYLGVDMVAGPLVDMVARADDLPIADESFDVVVSTEMLEHDPYFWKSLEEMTRVLTDGGWLLLTTRGIGFPFHEYPGDYWRFTEDAIHHLFTDNGLETVEVVPDPEQSGVFGLARK